MHPRLLCALRVVVYASTVGLLLSGVAMAQPHVIGTVSFGTSRAGVICINTETNLVYAAMEDARAIAVIDAASLAITATVATAGFHAGCDVNAVTNRIYVSQQFSGNVRIIDGLTNTFSDLPVPGLMHTVWDVAVNPMSNRLYVIRHNNSDIAVFDANTNTFFGAINPGVPGVAALFDLAVNPATRILYVSSHTTGTVTAIDEATHSVLGQIAIGGQPRKMAVDPSRNLVYVPGYLSNDLVLIDGNTNTVAATVAVGSGPVCAAVNPATNRVYVSNNSSNDVTVLDGATLGVVATVALTGDGKDVAVLPSLNRIFVACGNQVDVIEDIVESGPLAVNIDIKPGSDDNSINLGSNGVVPVAILGSTQLDAADINPVSVTLAGAPVKTKGKGTPMAGLQDVNGDGLLDLVVHVVTQALTLSASDTEAVLEGATYEDVAIQGTDAVTIVP